MDSERRQHERFLPQNVAFAALRSGFKKAGKIMDISMGGLSFSYFSEGWKESSISHYFGVDIFLLRAEFYLHNMPCKVVYDIPETTDDDGVFINRNRCGLSFGDYSKSHLDELRFFITHHTTGSSSP